MQTASLSDRRIDAQQALERIRNLDCSGSRKPDFRCLDCGRPVWPERAMEGRLPHFVHLSPNPDCPSETPA